MDRGLWTAGCGLWTAGCGLCYKPPFRPFNDRDAARLKVLLQSGRNNLVRSIEAVKIEVEERKSSALIDVYQGEGGGTHTPSEAEASSKSFDKLGLAGPKIP